MLGDPNFESKLPHSYEYSASILGRVASASLSKDEKEVYLLLNNHHIQVKSAQSRKLLRTINRGFFDTQSGTF